MVKRCIVELRQQAPHLGLQPQTAGSQMPLRTDLPVARFVAGKHYTFIPPIESTSLPQSGIVPERHTFSEGRCIGAAAGRNKYIFVGRPVDGGEEHFFTAEWGKSPVVEHNPVVLPDIVTTLRRAS